MATDYAKLMYRVKDPWKMNRGEIRFWAKLPEDTPDQLVEVYGKLITLRRMIKYERYRVEQRAVHANNKAGIGKRKGRSGKRNKP